VLRKIDAHMHLSVEHVKEALVTMDQNDVEFIVNAKCKNDRPAAEVARETRKIAGDRVATLSRLEYWWIEHPGYVASLVEQFRRDVDAGGKGLKIGKQLGLNEKYKDGTFIRVDDERLDPLWAAAAEMGVPVLIHTADPINNWLPLDERNPGFKSLRANPDVYFGDGRHYGRLDLLAQRERVLARHPKTVFVNAHWGCYPEDLDHLVRLFETYPNFYVDTEPGKITIVPKGKVHTDHRQVLIDYADRTLYGSDLAYRFCHKVDHVWNRGMYEKHFGWFETRDNGGAALPPDVLKKLYYENAKKVYHP
jgi:predicted TIM-barrel fold metal-dependent hydrolase